MASGYGLAGGTYDDLYCCALWNAAEALDQRQWIDNGYDCESMRMDDLRDGDGFAYTERLRGSGFDMGLCIGTRDVLEGEGRTCGGILQDEG